MLTEAIFMSNQKITIGLANDALLKTKKHKCFLESTELRQKNLQNLLDTIDADSTLQFDIQEISDPVGPAGVLEDLDAIIVSDETKSGGDYVNKIRQDKNLNLLKIHSCPVLLDSSQAVANSESSENSEEPASKKQKMSDFNSKLAKFEDKKISSSNNRIAKYGKLLKSPNPNVEFLSETLTTKNKQPYIIGLTGGSCSGKSSIGKKLEKIAFTTSKKVKIIDCDKLGHAAYNIDTNCYKKLVAHFSPLSDGKILHAETKQIDRAVLGSIVFKDKPQLKNLTDIVWPEIKNMVIEILENMNPDLEIAVIDAAILIEAGWSEICNEVWVSCLNREEAVKRIMERDGKSKEQAEGRLNSQMKDKERVEKAHVILTTQYEHEYTYEMCLKAWNELCARV